MASPQKENGYTAIANEIMDALCKIRIPGEARQVLDLIIRKTYGFNKKEDAISLTQFIKGTGLRKSTICRALIRLEEMNMVSQLGYSVAKIYRFNKDFHTWKPYPKKSTGTQIGKRGVLKLVNNRTQKRVLQKTVSKDTITKDIATPPPRENRIKDFFENVDDQEKIIQALVAKRLPEAIARQELAKFINYWSEANERGKQKWEFEKTFEIKKRLVTWFNNLNKWSSNRNNQRKAVKL